MHSFINLFEIEGKVTWRLLHIHYFSFEHRLLEVICFSYLWSHANQQHASKHK